jgi:pantetheine-phosphate adenylyltransferase
MNGKRSRRQHPRLAAKPWRPEDTAGGNGGKRRRSGGKGGRPALRIAVYPGSFDPVTLGHLDIIRRGAALFDRLVVAVAAKNPDKRSLFTTEERIDLVREATKDLTGVVVDAYEGLTAGHVAELGAGAILRGLRQHSDFEYEYQLALANRTISGIETVFVMADEHVAYISSHMVREVAALGGDISRFVPRHVAKAMAARIGTSDKQG